MKLISIIHNNGVRPPPRFQQPSSLRTSLISPPYHHPNWVRFPFIHSRSSSRGRCRCRPMQYSSIVSSRGTEQEEEYPTSAETSINIETETSSFQPDDNNNNVESSHTDSSFNTSQDRSRGSEGYMSSVRTVALCVFMAVAFGLGVCVKDGVSKGSEFFAGYLLEQSLSVDNLFVFVLIFKYFKVPVMYQNRVLSYGIIGAIVFRLSLILVGTATLQRFEAVNLLLAAILLYSSFKLFADDEDDSGLSDNFIVKTCQKFIPVTTNYDGNRFITNHNGVWKASNILGRLHLYF